MNRSRSLWSLCSFLLVGGLLGAPALAQKKKLSLAELAALEWKLEQAGNALLTQAKASERRKAVDELASTADPRAVPPLAQALREDPDPQIRSAAAEALARFKTPEAKGLLTVTSQADPDPGLRGKAAELLRRFPRRMTAATLPLKPQPFEAPGGKATLKTVQARLKLPSGDARLWAVQQIGAQKLKGGLSLLQRHLQSDPSPRVRVAAAEQLTKLLEAKALPQLIKAAGDGNPTVRFELARIIARHDDPAALAVIQQLARSDADETVKAEAQDLLEPATPVGRRLLKERIKKLGSANPAERVAALEELSESTHWRAMAPMSCSLLDDKSAPVRTAAARVLTNMHDRTVLTAMRVAAVTEPDQKLRATVRKLVMGMRQRVDELVGKLKSDDPTARMRAARALGQGVYPQGLEPLVAALKDKDAKVRLAAARGLTNFADPKAKQALKLAGSDADPRVRKVVDRAFARQQRLAKWRSLYKDANRLVMKTTDKDPVWRQDAAIALGVMGAEAAVGNLAQLLLHDKEETVRHAAAWALVLMASDRAEQALKTAAGKDPSQAIRLTARKYLVIAKVSLEDLLAQLADANPAVRLDAAEALSLRATSKALPYLVRAALCDAEAKVRAAALRGLARIANPMARSVIEIALHRDPAPEVRRAAMVMHILAGGS